MTYDNSHIPTTTQVNLTKDIDTGEKFLNQYKLISKLGNGHNGKVYLGLNVDTGGYYAIKEISKVSKISILNKDPQNQLTKINNEINIMKLIINHPKILKLHEILNDLKFNKIFLILEYCSKGDLKFGATFNYSIDSIRLILRDVVLGLEYLNGVGIIHRDIKPSNLLMNSDNFVKISDFGISIDKFRNSNINNFGTPAFTPPELCNGVENGNGYNKFDGKLDIWSLGVTIYCLYYQVLPFNGNNEYELFNEIINNEVVIPSEGDGDEQVGLLNDLLIKMLQKNPQKRISLQDLKNHPFTLGNFDHDINLQFKKFNEYYLFTRDENLSTFATKSSSSTTLSKFKSIFTRKSSISKQSSSSPPLASTVSLPAQQQQPIPSITLEQHSITQPTSLINTTTIPTTSFSIPSSTSNSPPSSLLKRPPLRSSSSQIASSTNSLNLNSLLRSKKPVPNYLDDSTFFQSVDSSSSDSDSTGDDSSDDDGLYNDVEDTLSFRIGPKRVGSSLQMRSVNDYLGV
ncbi:unnamed protein product [Wickerhamomyces anomalus]